MSEKPLTKRMEMFCRYYVENGFNATQAAISAGYSKKTANSTGPENLVKPGIQKKIDELIKEKWDRDEAAIEPEKIKQRLKQIAFSQLSDYLITDNGRINIAVHKFAEINPAAIKKFRAKDGVIEIELRDNVPALLALGKYYGMDKPQEHKHEVEIRRILIDDNY